MWAPTVQSGKCYSNSNALDAIRAEGGVPNSALS